MKRGYKQTEVGVIPEDWELIRLGEVSEVKTGPFGSSLHESDYVNDGTPIITVEHLGDYGVEHSNLPLVSDADRQRLRSYSLVVGDIVFSRVGSVDRNALIRQPEAGWLFSGRLLRVRPSHQRVSSSFLSHQFHGSKFKRLVRNVAVGQTMACLNTQILKRIFVSLPPIPEQLAIAEVLNDIEGLLVGLERLIAKKRDIKQAVMQQVLTGKTRLPGFKDKWETKQVASFANCVTGGTPNTRVKSYWDGSIKWMSSGDLHLKRVKDVPGRITQDGLDNSAAAILPMQCVLIGLAGQGKTRGTVAINMAELSTNQSIGAILPNDTFVPDYLYHNLDSRYTELRELSSGGGRGGLNLKLLGSVEIPLPSIPEQAAIACVLSDMDAEILALEARRDKTRALKQGMMQELLIGKTRLI